eukprot:2841412-Amphidinium_carterae.1
MPGMSAAIVANWFMLNWFSDTPEWLRSSHLELKSRKLGRTLEFHNNKLLEAKDCKYIEVTGSGTSRAGSFKSCTILSISCCCCTTHVSAWAWAGSEAEPAADDGGVADAAAVGPCVICHNSSTGIKALASHLKRVHSVKSEAYNSTSLACLIDGVSLKDEEAESLALATDGDKAKFFCKLRTPRKNLSRGYFAQHMKTCHDKVDTTGWVLKQDWHKYHNRSSERLGVFFDAAVAMRAASDSASSEAQQPAAAEAAAAVPHPCSCTTFVEAGGVGGAVVEAAGVGGAIGDAGGVGGAIFGPLPFRACAS